MTRQRSFQTRVLVALFATALLPTLLAVVAGAVLLGGAGRAVGTLGPWDEAARTGQALAEQALRAAPDDPGVVAAAERHRTVLSESVRRSRLWALLTRRAQALLPLGALVTGLLLAGVALLGARWVSGPLSRPLPDLVEWTELIARGEPLPEPAATEPRGIREIAELRAALRRMSAQLAEGRRREVEAARLRAWTDMARRVAHELKNPLTPMRMATAALARRDEPEIRSAVEVLEEEVERLDAMARAFSRFGRPPEGPRSEVDLVELLQGVARRSGTSDVDVRLTAEVDATLTAHLDALERAFHNLALNAVEATPGEGVVELRLTSDGPGRCLVEVLDRGAGIDEELGERIWEPDVTTKHRGTGLGLALVRQTVLAHGGEVGARPRPGGGTVFTVRLPLAATHAEAT